jgi:MoaA/NifB/PqqE/SkfB family radical SAM enzyme
MGLGGHIQRLFDDKPWAAHLYVTEQCNLDCHYCNEYDNSLAHPSADDVKAWISKIRALGAMRIGFQGGEPLLHPNIVDFVRHARDEGLMTSMATNGFPLTRQMLKDLEAAGLESLHLSVDRMTPIPSTRKSLKSVLHKLAWFDDSPIRLVVAGVLFEDTMGEMAKVIDTCLDRGVRVHARVIHDDLINGRTLRNEATSKRLLAFIEAQEALKAQGEKIHTSWNILAYQKAFLRGEDVDWTCTAGHKYFFVSSTGKFWLCSQVRTDKHIMDITSEDLNGYIGKKDCQKGCGVYCIADTSMMANQPAKFLARHGSKALSARVRKRMRRGAAPGRIGAIMGPVIETPAPLAPVAAELHPRDPRIEPAAGKKVGMTTLLDNTPRVHDHDPVGLQDGR